MKYYYLLGIFFFYALSLISQTEYTGKEFTLPDANSPIISAENNTYKASESIKLQNGFNYDAALTNKRFKAKIDLNLIFDVEIENGFTNNIFEPTGRPLDETKEVGKIPGNYTVDNVGGFNYVIPIQLPPGSNGVTPEVSIAYSSNSPSGIMGLGWNLSGLSAISRSTKSNYYDGITEALQLDNTDPFILDGQRLIKDGSIYRTESENYARIVPTSITADGPARWEVFSKDGTSLQYGNSGDARITYGTKRISWLIHKVTDLNGNYIDYKYREVNGQKLIDEISYTGNSTTQPYNKVKFVYIEKGSDEKSFKYAHGFKIRHDYLLDKIVTYSHDSPILEYSIVYQNATEQFIDYANSPQITNFGKFQIKEIKLKSLIGGEEYHSTIFRYGNGTNQVITVPLNSIKKENVFSSFVLGDINNDGLTDIHDFEVNLTTGYISNLKYQKNLGSDTYDETISSFSFYQSKPVDVKRYWDAFNKTIRSTDLNEDGKDDLIISENGQIGATSYTFIKRFMQGTIDNDYLKIQGITPSLYSFALGDFTGDGLPDGISYYNNSSTSSPFIRFSLKDFENGTPNTQIDLEAQSFWSGLAWDFTERQNALDCNLLTFDYDGDGTVEIFLWNYGGSTMSYIILDIVESGGSYILSEIVRGFNFVGSNTYNKIQVGDFNGDGISDFMAYSESSNSPIKIIHNGEGVFTKENTSFAYNPTDKWFFIDLNGDQHSDLVRLASTGSETGLKTYYSNGKVFDQNRYANISSDFDDLSNFSFGDFNGDNSLELFYVERKEPDGNLVFSLTPTIRYFVSSPKSKKIYQIRNGLNQDLEIEYVYNSNPDEKYDISGSAYDINGTYENGHNSQFINPTAGNIFLNQQLLLTKQIKKSLEAANDNSNTNYYGITEKFFYSSAIFNKRGKGLIGMGKKYVSMPYQGKRASSFFKFENNCNCLIPKHNYLQEYPLSSTSDVYEQTDFTHSVSSLLSGKRFLIQQTQLRHQNFVTKVDQTTDYTYYSSGNLKKTTTDDGVYENSVEIKSYGKFGTAFAIHPTEIESIKDNKSETGNHTITTNLDYFTNGNLKEKINYSGNTDFEVKSEYSYDDYGNVISITSSSLGLPTLVSNSLYDQHGQFAEWTENAKGQKTHFEVLKPFGLPLAVKSPNNNRASFKYNGFGRKLSETGADGNITSLEVEWNTTPGSGGGPIFNNANFYYVKKSTPGFPEQKTVFDYLERPVSKEIDGWDDKIVSSTEYFYEAGKDIGLVKRQSIPQFSQSADPIEYIDYEYDKLQRLIEISHPHISTKQTVAYPVIPLTLANYEVTTTAFDGQATTQKLDGAGQLLASVDDGGTILYNYNNQGLQKDITLPGQVMVSFEYDVAGNQTKLNDPNSGITNYLYNAYGNIVEQSDAKGLTSLAYNNFNELVSKINPLGTVGYEYVNGGNGLNQIKRITHTNGSEESFQYDRVGRTVQYDKVIDNETYTYQYSYDAYGREHSVKYPSGFTTNSEYTAEGFLKKIKNADDATIIWEGIEMNDKGQYTEVQKGSNLPTEHNYDNLAMPTQLRGELDLDYSFEAKSGNLSNWTDIDNSLFEEFEYDNNRLKRMNLKQSNVQISDQSIEYEANGNISKKGAIENYAYHPTKKNAVTSVEDPTAQIPAAPQTIEYNALNQPSTITEGTNILELTYGAGGQRIQTKLKDNNETLKRTRTYLPNYEVQEFVANNKKQQIHYIAGGDGLAAIYVIEDGVGSIYYAHTNHLGSILKLTDETATTSEEQSFDAWGRRRNADDWTYSAIASVPDWLYRGYTGHEHYDEFGLINMNGRMYDPDLGRMLSVDNYVQDLTNTQSYNRYSYVRNNPLKYTDPSGEFLLGIVAFIVVGSADILTGNWKGWEGSGKPAVMAGVAAGIGSIGASTPSGLGLLKFAGSQLINKYTPSATIPINDNLSLNFSIGATYGSEQIGASVFGSATVSSGDFSITGGAGVRGFSKNFGPGGASFEGISNYGASYDDGNFGITLNSTSFYNSKTPQKIGGVGLRFGDVSIYSENDFFLGGDGKDRLRTASFQVNYKDYSAGFNIYTGDPGDGRNNGKIYTGSHADDYRAGALYFGYKGYRIGSNSEQNRHAIQNRFAHDILINKALSRKNPSYHFRVMDVDKANYFQIGRLNKFTLW